MYATIIDGYTHFHAGRIGKTYPICNISPALNITIVDNGNYVLVQSDHYEMEGF